jgi:thiamine-phosphate pyrophosphorylase
VKQRNLICLVTDRHRLSPEAAPEESLERLVHFAGAAASAGVDLIQLRERDLDARRLTSLTERCIEAAGAGRVLVNDRLDVAMAAGASGVHLRSDSVEAALARAAVPPGFIIGRSVHSVDEAIEKERGGALDYLLFGTVFGTVSKPDGEPAGVEPLRRICASVSIPVLAIGGITLERAALVTRAGASGVAAIGLFVPPRAMEPERHLATVVETLRRVFDTCGAVP